MKTLLSVMALVVGLTFGTVTFVQADEKAAAPAAPEASAPATPAAAPEEKKVDTKKAEKKESKKKAEKTESKEKAEKK